MAIILKTDRLILRTWQDSDVQPMAVINQDVRVMQYFPSVQDIATTTQFIHKVRHHFDQHGFSLYATVRKDTQEFIGFVGLFTANFDAPFTPAVEIGWRLSSAHWGQGFATEAAKSVLGYAFDTLHLPEIVSFTSETNRASCRVMEKIGLRHNSDDDFDHPNIADGSALKHHVLYRLTRAQFTGRSHDAH